MCSGLGFRSCENRVCLNFKLIFNDITVHFDLDVLASTLGSYSLVRK